MKCPHCGEALTANTLGNCPRCGRIRESGGTGAGAFVRGLVVSVAALFVGEVLFWVLFAPAVVGVVAPVLWLR